MRWNAGLAALAAAWGLVAVLAGAVSVDAGPLAFLRLALAALTLARRRPPDAARPLLAPGPHLRMLIVLGIVQAAHWWLFFETVKRGSVALAVLTFYTAPIFLAVLAPLFLPGAALQRRPRCPRPGRDRDRARRARGRGRSRASAGSRRLRARLGAHLRGAARPLEAAAARAACRRSPSRSGTASSACVAISPALLFAGTVLPADAGEWAAVLVLGIGLTGLSTLAYASLLRHTTAQAAGHPRPSSSRSRPSSSPGPSSASRSRRRRSSVGCSCCSRACGGRARARRAARQRGRGRSRINRRAVSSRSRSHRSRPQPGPRARPGDRGGGDGGRGLDRPRRQERRRRRGRRPDAADDQHGHDAGRRRDRRGGEGRGADAVQRRARRRRLRARGRRRRRPARGHAPDRVRHPRARSRSSPSPSGGSMFFPGAAVYMEKIAVGPEGAGAIDLDALADRERPGGRRGEGDAGERTSPSSCSSASATTR